MAASPSFAQQAAQREESPPADAAQPPSPIFENRDSVFGWIADKRERTPRNADQPNAIILVKTAQGRNIAVDIGPAAAVNMDRLNIGTAVSASGTAQEIQGRWVLLAMEAHVGQDIVQIHRTAPTTLSRQDLNGRIVKMQVVDIKNHPLKHVVAIIETDAGKQLYADLGPSAQIEHLELKEASELTIHGFVRNVQGRPILMASELEAGGQSVPINNVMLPMNIKRQALQIQEDSQ